METRGLDTVPQYPFLPSSAIPPSLAFFPLASFPFCLDQFPRPTVLWLAHP